MTLISNRNSLNFSLATLLMRTSALSNTSSSAPAASLAAFLAALRAALRAARASSSSASASSAGSGSGSASGCFRFFFSSVSYSNKHTYRVRECVSA